MTLYCGIDPGKAGAWAVVNWDGSWVDGGLVPMIGKEYDERGMVRHLSFCLGRDAHFAIEKVGAMPGQGVTSMFSFGQGYGLWRGIVVGLGLSYELVRPQAWQKEMLAGLPRGKQTKESAVQKAKQLWPEIPINRKKDWGLADAALIAEWLRRTRKAVAA